MLKFANMNLQYNKYSLEYFLDSTQRVGLDAIELWGGIPHLYVDDVSYQDVRSIGKQIKMRNLNLICFTPEQCIYPINLSAKDDTTRNRSIEYFKKSIEVANTLETKKMLVSVGSGLFNESAEEAWNRASSSLQILTKEAEEKGIILVLEQMSRMGSNVINNIHTLKKMHEEIDSPCLKVMVDTVLMEVVGDQLHEYIVFGEDLVHMHFIDGDTKTTAHLPWGEGICSLDKYKEVIRDMEYTGYLTLELISPKYNRDPEKGIRESLEFIRKNNNTDC